MDDIDLNIIRTLSENGRASYEVIAKSTGLTGNAVRNRVQKMMEKGVIDRFFLCVNPANLGYNIVIAIFEQGDNDDAFEELKALDDTMFVVNALNGVGAAVFTFREENWDEKVRKIFSKVKSASLFSAFLYQKPSVVTQMGKIDWDIAESLKDDVRKPVHDIANELRISAKTVKRHLDKLTEGGILQPMVLIQPMRMERIIPYYLLIELDDRAEKNKGSPVLNGMFDRYWFKQRVSDSSILIMQLYAHSFAEIEENKRLLLQDSRIKNMIFFYPSQIYFSERYKECMNQTIP
jgi:DNA-binding Lrp family transcriptional regulator